MSENEDHMRHTVTYLRPKKFIYLFTFGKYVGFDCFLVLHACIPHEIMSKWTEIGNDMDELGGLRGCTRGLEVSEDN